jgi:hypothetical protein
MPAPYGRTIFHKKGLNVSTPVIVSTISGFLFPLG